MLENSINKRFLKRIQAPWQYYITCILQESEREINCKKEN